MQRATRLLHRAEAANKRTANQGGHILRQLELFLRWSFFVHRTRVIFLLLVLATQIAPSCRLPESKAPGRSVQAQHSVFAMPGDRMACGRSTAGGKPCTPKAAFQSETRLQRPVASQGWVLTEGESSLRLIVSVPSCHEILCYIFDSFSDYSRVLIYIRRQKRSLRPQYDIIRSNEVQEWDLLVLE